MNVSTLVYPDARRVKVTNKMLSTSRLAFPVHQKS